MGVVKTFYLDVLEYCNNVGIKYQIQNTNLTLDESLNNYKNYIGNNPFLLQYISIGYTTASNVTVPPINMIKSDHGALDYKIQNTIPFRYRSINNDLSVEEQQNYRMKILSKDNKYWLYYLKKFEVTHLQPYIYQIQNITSISQSISPINFFELEAYLNNEGLVNFQYSLTLSSDEINEITQYLQTLNNTIPSINTVGICIGQDDGKEAHNVQIGYFSNTNILLNQSNTYEIDIGRFGTI